jgi:predicted DNA-binding transcriptional regulator AlpA
VTTLRLMGVTEVAEFLCVPRSRVYELDRRNPRFPQPVARLACGPIWRAEDVEAFENGWERKPGRPRKQKENERS